MPFIEWSEKLSVNVSKIDEHHKVLIKYINDLFDAMSTGKGKDVLDPILTGLVDYTKFHFSTEEKFMDQFGYHLSISHKNAHKELTAQVVELLDKFKSEKTNLSIPVMHFLKDWLNNHILNVDKKLAEFLNQKGMK